MCEDFDSASGHVILDQETLEQLEADVNSVHCVSIWISFDSVDEESEGELIFDNLKSNIALLLVCLFQILLFI